MLWEENIPKNGSEDNSKDGIAEGVPQGEVFWKGLTEEPAPVKIGVGRN